MAANAVFGTGVVAAVGPETRVISVKVAADSVLRENPTWRESITRWVAQVDAAYRDTFDIRWTIAETVEWTPTAEARTALGMLAILEKDVAVDEADIVLGFMGQPVFGTGASRSFDTHALVAVGSGFNEARIAIVIAHELGHLFGAWHHRDSDSVMFNRGASMLRFDPITRSMIRLMRDFDFESGVTAIDSRTAWEIGRIFSTGHAPGTVDPIALAHATRGMRFAAIGEREKAISALGKASRRSPYCGECQRRLAHILFEHGAYERARTHMGMALLAGVTPNRAFMGQLNARLYCGGLYAC